MKSFTVAVLLAAAVAQPAWALGERPFVTFDAARDAVVLARAGQAARIVVDPADFAGVRRAAADLQGDVERVSGVRPALVTSATVARGSDVVIVGTLGRSALIDRLARAHKIDTKALRGKWEGYLVQAVRNPLPGVARALVVAGSDKRGTIYGLYTVSEQIGVSPWHWWADVPAPHHDVLAVAAGTRVADAPVVRYRGIFLNDEAPALSGWAKEKFGGLNHRFYAKVFELILRMRGNYLWPAMWNNAFFDDDPENGPLADEMGIVMGTSHHEPMMRAQQEWHRIGMGPKQWNYDTNKDRLQAFWRGGFRRARDWDKLVTMGMRGDGDEPMAEHADLHLLERIVADQRRIIGEETGKPPANTPQLWALYKEVQEYYDKGMRVPDDVTLLWCDDNWGNIRRLPTPEERRRSGGAGIYYHFDYVGGPRSYKWINVTPLPKVWEQMHLAWRYGADRLWVVNVGDLKPMEVPIEFFLTYAWNPQAWPAERLPDYLKLWATREFGAADAAEIADIVATYARYNGRRKPEQLAPDTYSATSYREAERIVADWRDLAARAARVKARLAPAQRDAFFQLVEHPVRAAGTLGELYATVQANRIHAQQGRADTNALAARARDLFAEDAAISREYHEINGGKWNHMMAQTHIGYTSWRDPDTNIMPDVRQIALPAAPALGVAVEGTEAAWPTSAALHLPPFEPFDKSTRAIEVFDRGAAPLAWQARADAPWIVLSNAAGTTAGTQRIEVDVHWDRVPAGAQAGHVVVTGPDGQAATIEVPLRHGDQRAAPVAGFVETGGTVAIEAEHYARAAAPDGRSWLRVPGLGRTLSGMTTLPAVAPAVLPAAAPRLEYDVYLFEPGKVDVQATLSPTLKFQPGAGLRYAVAIDDEPPQIVNVHADDSLRHWEKIVSDGVAQFTTAHAVKAAGRHTLKVWALDPGIVLQRLVIDAGGLKPSYLGPPESPHIGTN